MLTKEQQDILSELANSYRGYKFICPQDWVKKRGGLDAGIGRLLIDRCLNNAEFTRSVLMTIAEGLKQQSGSDHANARQACQMFEELYRQDTDYQRVIKEALNDAVAVKQLESTGDLSSVMQSLAYFRDIMRFAKATDSPGYK